MAEKENGRVKKAKEALKQKIAEAEEILAKVKEEVQQKVVLYPETGRISMWLDDYDDLFSDFDPRPYEEKVLSDDFLNEYHHMLKEKKEGGFELNLLVPHAVRNEKDEETIKKRLRSYFKNNEREYKFKITKKVKNGAILAVIGFSLMLLSAFLLYFHYSSLVSKMVVVIIDPAGWFMM